MKLFICTILFFTALSQAHRDVSKFKSKNLYVMPRRPAPFYPRIVGGQEANLHQFPYQVALLIDEVSICGGSIVRANVIATAAHCCEGAKSIEVIAGAHNLSKLEPTQQSITSNKWIIHEDWDPSSLENDVAVIILPGNFTLDDTAKISYLRYGKCNETVFDGAVGTVSGWGRYSDRSNSISPVLRYTSNVLLRNTKCAKYFSNIKDTHICLSGANGKGACNGDSGGPLFALNGDRVEQVGIVSFGSAMGCEKGYPSVYSRVSCFHDWILSKVP